MTKAIIVCGSPAAGKTTYGKEAPPACKHVVIAGDENTGD
jgi:type IV secretory pathway ATPase VirB11/archaellum biosynthesis ATPase